VARRPVRRWLCRRCVEAGLSGQLEIFSIPFAASFWRRLATSVCAGLGSRGGVPVQSRNR
jgi:hypothetical protein